MPISEWTHFHPKHPQLALAGGALVMQRDGVVLNRVLRIFLRGIAQSLQAHCPGAAQVAKANEAALHIGAVAIIHRSGASLNEHVHFHVCVVDGCLR